jgi:carbon-monoxide dehydrogenase medium subunit
LKASPFRYIRASSVDEVYELLAQYGDEARILAGGQSLIAALNMRLAAPAVLIDINGLTELSGIRVAGEAVRIGALTRHRAVERSAEIARCAPLLAQAMPHVAHAAIRNRGTFGGSIAFADPAAELPACSVALDAQFVLTSRAGERRVPARRFFKGLYETGLEPGELLSAAEFPALGLHYRSAFLELARRHGDYAIAGVAAHAAFHEGRFSDVSIVFFGVGDKPVLASAAAAALEARAYSNALVEPVKTAVATDVKPDADIYHSAATKLHLAQVLAARAITALAQNREYQ